MTGVHFDSARANLPCGKSSLYESSLNRLQIFQRRRTPVGLPGMGKTRRTQRRILRIGAAAAFLADGSFVPQLHEHSASGAVNGIEASGPRAHGGVGNAAKDGSLRGRRMIDSAGLRDDETHAAFDALALVVRQAP